MKTRKKFSKKLMLNKITILDMDRIYGGDETGGCSGYVDTNCQTVNSAYIYCSGTPCPAPITSPFG